MNCCINCFNNKFIIEYIKDNNLKGNCNYCKSHSIPIMSVKEVGEYIRESLEKGYVNATLDEVPYKWLKPYAEPVFDILRYTEEIFSAKLDNDNTCEELMEDLFKYSDPSHSLSYRDIAQGASDYDEWEQGFAKVVLKGELFAPDDNRFYYNWEQFKEVVKYENRFFDLNEKISREELLSTFEVFLKDMKVEIPKGSLIWRARINSEGPFEDIISQTFECGPPPAKFSKSFRMNPEGISYFYGSQDKNTCIAEIRPGKSDDIVFGQFKTKQSLNLIDLSNVPKVSATSVFDPDYDHDLNWISDFLKSFCTEISQPVNEENALDYIPTQILCEYIRSKGFDGVRYHSSLTRKENYTLFCGRKKDDYNRDYDKVKGFISDFNEWLELVEYEYIENKIDLKDRLENKYENIIKKLNDYKEKQEEYYFDEILEFLEKKQYLEENF